MASPAGISNPRSKRFPACISCAFNDVIAAGGRLTGADGSEQLSCCTSLTLWAVVCEQFLFEKLAPSSTIDKDKDWDMVKSMKDAGVSPGSASPGGSAAVRRHA
jgi:hypothetical protein